MEGNHKMELIYILLSAVAFTTFEPVAKLLGGTISPLPLTMLRFAIGGLVLLPPAVYQIRKNKIKIGLRDFVSFIILGILCICFSMTLLQVGLIYTTASSAAIIFSSNPVFTVVFAHTLLNEKLDKKKSLALIISMAGVFCTLDFSNGFNGIVGLILAFISAVSFSLYTVLTKKLLSRFPAVVNNTFVFLAGSFVLMTILLFTKYRVIHIENNNILPLLYLGVVVTGLGYLFYFSAMKKGGAKAAATVFLIKPVLVPIFAFIIIRENVRSMTIVGILLVITGSFLLSRINTTRHLNG